MRRKSWKGFNKIASRNVSNCLTLAGRSLQLHKGLFWRKCSLNDYTAVYFSEVRWSGNIFILLHIWDAWTDIRECTMKMWPEGVRNSGGSGRWALEFHVEFEDHVADWMSARWKAWVSARWLAGIAVSNTAGNIDLSIGSVCVCVCVCVCCQVAAPASGRSLVLRSPTDCGVFQIVCDLQGGDIELSRAIVPQRKSECYQKLRKFCIVLFLCAPLFNCYVKFRGNMLMIFCVCLLACVCNVCVYVCMYVCMYAWMHACICVCIIYVCINV